MANNSVVYIELRKFLQEFPKNKKTCTEPCRSLIKKLMGSVGIKMQSLRKQFPQKYEGGEEFPFVLLKY